MAVFKNAFEILKGLEFNAPSNCLHKNKGENGFTFYGIYEGANPDWEGWFKIYETFRKTKNIKTASLALYDDYELIGLVRGFYKTSFWNEIKGDEITSQIIANELFIFGVNAGISQAVKLAQRILKIKDDGVLGNQTLKALNSYDEVRFSKAYDEAEINFYITLSENNPAKQRFLKGWINRAKSV